MFLKELFNGKNCYESCEYYYYNEENNNYCTDNNICPEKYNKLIIDKRKCIDDCWNDSLYIYEYENSCFINCPNGSFHLENDTYCYKKKEIETVFIYDFDITEVENTTILYDINISEFEKSTINYHLNISKVEDTRDKDIQMFLESVSDFNISDNKDIIDKKDNITFQLTTSEKQKNNTNKNMSSIDLGDCERELKREYKIDENLPLIIFKVDYFSPDTLIPIIGYEIYHPIYKYKLNLTVCEEIFIKLNIPVSIDESKLYKYDPNSGFYKDNCFPYTTEDGTDIILNDRKQEFTQNNLSLCQNDCNYTGYDSDKKQSSCDCNVKNKMDLISEMMDNPNKLSNSFDSEEGNSNSGASNIISIKCTKALFSKDGLKNNISSYILIIFITQFLLSIVLFIKCGYRILESDINNILKEKEKIQKTIAKKNQLPMGRNTKRIPIGKSNIKRKKMNYPPKKINFKFINQIKGKEIKSNSKNKIKTLNLNNKNSSIKTKTNYNISQINNISQTKEEKKIINKIRSNKSNNNIVRISYNESELNLLNYKNAILYDKRSCFQYYLSLIKSKNPILFPFCPANDYNSRIIKLCILSLSFSIYYAVNFAFFDDKMLHQIYETGGKYDIAYFIPKIVISFAVSYFITIIIKLIFLSERNIFQIKIQPNLSMASNISYKEKRNLVIKYTLFFILGIAFLFFFWMLLSSFGAVYQNTQIFIFKNTLISFAISLLFPFFTSIFPCIFRISSISSLNNECMFKLSKFLQVL